MVLIGPGSRDLSCEPTPHPAYGSEVSTDGNRLVRATNGNGAGCRFTLRPEGPKGLPLLRLKSPKGSPGGL